MILLGAPSGSLAQLQSDFERWNVWVKVINLFLNYGLWNE